MDFKAERVTELNCGRCGTRIDPTEARPLSKIDCPKCGAKVSVPAVFGDFLLAEVLGAGAAGIVCKGFDQSLHRQVAIKILRTGERDSELVEQCTREARALAALNHPHVVQVHSIGEYRGQPFIVMELLDGGDVQGRMVGKRNGEVESLDIAMHTAEGLAAAHRAGLVHMDVKPGNILFDGQGRAKLIDFGVAQVARRSTDQVAGTPYYVAPEVIRGQPADFNADIYSLGSTLYHLLAGQPPFEGADANALLKKKLRKSPRNLFEIREDIHPRTAEVVNRMLAREPGDRYANYDELLDDLRDARASALTPLESRAIHELISASSGPVTTPSPMMAAARTAHNETAAGKSIGIGQIAGIAVAASLLIGVLIVVMLAGGSPAQEPGGTPPIGAGPRDGTAPLSTIIPASQTVGSFATDPAWHAIDFAMVVSSGGATVDRLDDRTLLFTGNPADADTYTLTGPTDTAPIYAIGIEVLPHDSLERGGPGRRDGAFYVSRVTVESAAKATPNAFTAVELIRPEASYEQDGFPLRGTLDDAPKTAWGIAPRFGRAHTALYRLAKPIEQADGAVLRIVIEHHPEYRSSIGRLRIWVTSDERYAPEAPPVAVNPTPPDPTPAPTPTPPKPEPEPPKVEPTVAQFAPMYPADADLGDLGVWHTVDVVNVESSGGANLTKLPDGSILAAGPNTKGDMHTITALTRLRGVRAIRVEALPDDSLPGKGPGRDPDAKVLGRFCVANVTLAAAPGDDPAAAVPVNLVEAGSTPVRNGHAARNVLDPNALNGFASPPNTAGQPASLWVKAESPIGESDRSVLVLTLRFRGDETLGRYRISAITSEDTKPDAPAVPQPPRSDVEFVAVAPTQTAASRESTFTPQPDGSVLVDSRLFKDNDYTIVAEVGPAPITALRLEAMADPSLPKSGPGLVSSGIFAIKEISLKAAAKDRPNNTTAVTLVDPAVDYAEDRFTGDLAFDGKEGTYWAVRKSAGETRTVTFRPQSPIAHPAGTILTLRVSQELAIGRFRLSYTTMPDPAPLAVKPASDPTATAPKPDDPPKPDEPKPAPPPPAKPVAMYFNLGGPEWKDPDGNIWVPAVAFKKGHSGYVGRAVPETLEGGHNLFGTSLLKINAFRATVPHATYFIDIRIGHSQDNLLPGSRRFTIKLEGQPQPQDIEPASIGKGRVMGLRYGPIAINDGVVDVEFVPAGGAEGAMVSGIAIIPAQ